MQDYAIERLRELAPDALLGVQHFFFAIGLHKPHMPWDFPEEFLQFYPEQVGNMLCCTLH